MILKMSKYIPEEKAKRYAVVKKYNDGDEIILEYFNTIEEAEIYIKDISKSCEFRFTYYIGKFV